MQSILSLILLYLCLQATAQPQDFEGVIIYSNKVQSKVPEISNASWERSLLVSNSHKVFIRHGFYRRSQPLVEEYFYPKDQKVYYKYKGVDTLFYIDYTNDSSKLVNVIKYDTYSFVNNIKCNKLKVETDLTSITYEYSPTLYMNPVYDANNLLNRFDAYMQEAQAVYLSQNYDCSVYSHLQTAIQVQSQILDDSIFTLPHLPIRKYAFESIGTPPKFTGGIPAYVRFLEKNLNGQLGPKYIKLPKGKQMATQVVKMRFIVDEQGTVTNVEVINEREVHPKLADEALRVMRKCPAWQPSELFGKKVVYRFRNSVTFVVTK